MTQPNLCAGKIIKTRRTIGLVSQRLTAVNQSQSATPTLTGSPETQAPDLTEHVDMYGIGY